MILNWLKTNKKEILISFSVGIILIYLQPFLLKMGSVFIDYGLEVSNKFSSYIYQLAATLDPHLSVDFLSSVTVLLFLISVISFFDYRVDQMYEIAGDGRKLLEKVRNEKKIVESKLAQFSGGMMVEIPDYAAILKELTGFEQLGENLLKKAKKRMRFFLILSVFVFLYVISLSIRQSIYTYVNRINNKFENQLIILSSVLESKDIYKLKSDWIRMKSKNDFILIQEKITKLFEANKLPPLEEK